MIIDDCLLKNFLTLSEDEKLMVLKWRNHNNIRLWMHNTNIISITDHLEFINKLKNDDKNKYFLAVKNKNYIGVIYFNNINYEQKECEFGLYVNPYKKLVGIGKILNDICIKYVFNILKLKKIKLEVLNNNKRAIKLYQKYNFMETGIKIVNDKHIICMELENENR